MPWFRVDDSFYDHPKVFDAPDSAVALWIRAGTWSARSLTDGYVPAAMLARFCSDPDTAAAELVRRRLWTRVRGGYKFHDWHKYQPTKEAVENERKQARDRMRTLREARSSSGKADVIHRADGRSSQGKDGGPDSDNSRSDGKSFGRTSPEQTPNFARSSQPPARPDPKNGSVVTGTERGSFTTPRKPHFDSHSNGNGNGTASRQPPPVGEAIAAALNPRGRHARDNP